MTERTKETLRLECLKIASQACHGLCEPSQDHSWALIQMAVALAEFVRTGENFKPEPVVQTKSGALAYKGAE